MKRVVCAVTNDLNNDQRMHRICGSLKESGFEVLLVGRQKPNSKSLDQKPFQQKRLKCWFNKGKLFYLEYNLRLFLFLLANRSDIINAVDLDSLLACWLTSGLKGNKLVFDAHEYFEEVPEVVNRPLVKGIWSWLGKTFVPRVDVAYTVNESLSQEFNKIYNKPFGVILNVPKSHEKSIKTSAGFKTQEPCLLYQGALNKGRGLEQLLQAMIQIEMPLKIAGEGDLSKDLRMLKDELNLGSRVEFLGMIPPTELRTLTENSYIGLNLLSAESPSYYLSLANKFFDYMHADVPSINMNFPEYRKINQHFEIAVLIENLEPDEISGAINSLINNQEMYLQLKSNCQAARETYHWQIEAKKLADIYTSL